MLERQSQKTCHLIGQTVFLRCRQGLNSSKVLADRWGAATFHPETLVSGGAADDLDPQVYPPADGVGDCSQAVRREARGVLVLDHLGVAVLAWGNAQGEAHREVDLGAQALPVARWALDHWQGSADGWADVQLDTPNQADAVRASQVQQANEAFGLLRLASGPPTLLQANSS